MPKLDLITAPAGTSPDRLLDVRRARAPDTGMGDLAAGLQGAAGAFAAVQHDKLREQERINLRDAQLDQSERLADARSTWTTRLRELQDAAPEGAPGFTASLLKEYDEYARGTVKNAPQIVQRELKTQLVNFRTQLADRAEVFEGTERAAAAVNKFNRSLDLQSNAVSTDPSQFDDALADALTAIDNLNVPDGKKPRLRELARDSLSVSAVSSLILRAPREAYDSLKAGDWDTHLPPDKKLVLLNRAESAADRVDAGALAEARDLIADHVSSVEMTGKGVAGVHAKARAALKPHQYQQFVKAEAAAQKVFEGIDAMKFAPISRVGEVLERFKPEPGAPGYADDLKRFQSLQQATQKMIQQRIEDPAGYAMQMPEIRTAFEAAETVDEHNPSGQDEFRLRAVDKLIEAQKYLGVPAHRTRVLSKGQAQEMANRLLSAPSDARGAFMLQTQHAWGRHFNAVLKDLGDKDFNGIGISAGVQVLAHVAGQPGVAQKVATALETPTSELAKGLDGADVGEIKKMVASQLGDWRAAVETGSFSGGRAKQVNAIVEQVERLALLYRREGRDIDDAVEAAVGQAVLNDTQVSGAVWAPLRTEKGTPIDLGRVDNFGRITLGDRQTVEGMDLDLIRGGDSKMEFLDRERTIRTVMNSGLFTTNESGTGIILMIPFRDGSRIPAIRKDGSRVEYSFEHIMTVGRSDRDLLDDINRDANALLRRRARRGDPDVQGPPMPLRKPAGP